MGRCVNDDHNAVLPVQQCVNFRFQRRQIKSTFIRQHLIGIQLAPHIQAQYLISSPVPVCRNHRIAGFRIVPDCMMDTAGSAGSCYCTRKSVGTGFAKCRHLYLFQIIRRTGNRCIGNHLINRKITEYRFYCRKAYQF